MVYVARYSDDIEYDLVRGWSGFGVFEGRERFIWKTIFEYARAMLIDEQLEEKGLEVTEENILLHKEPYIDLRYDAAYGIWREVHHDGLSCGCLDAESKEDAIVEARTKDRDETIFWGGWAYGTTGHVRVVAQVTEKLYVLECDGVQSERD